MQYQRILALGLLMSLSGCGGGGGDSPAPVTPEVPQYLVSIQAGAGGSLSPASTQVRQGSTATFSVSAATGYEIDSVSGCAGSLTGNQYTTGAVNAACTVTASFKKLSYTVSVAATVGGSVTPAMQKVEHGNTTTVTLKPNTGFSINSASGCNGQLQGEVYRTGTILDDCNVDVVFGPVIQVVTTTSSGGKLNLQNPQVKYGESLQLRLLPDPGFDITTASGCGGKLQGSVFTTAPIRATCTVEAKFNVDTIVEFPDPSLDTAVRQHLGLDATEAITKTKLAELTNLYAAIKKIADLQGLQHAKNLSYIRLVANNISDLTPLQNLTQLTTIEIGSNPIASLKPLSALTHLRYLDVSYAATTDLSPLRGMLLTGLELANTGKFDLSPLKDMPLSTFWLTDGTTADLSPLVNAPLEELRIHSTKVSDLAVLTNLAGLKRVVLEETDITDLKPLRQSRQITSLAIDMSLFNRLEILDELSFSKNAYLSISGCLDQTGYSRHLEQLTALKNKHDLTLQIAPYTRTDCPDTLAGVEATMQAKVIDRTLHYSWDIRGSSVPVKCAFHLDLDDQQPQISASSLQACANTGSAIFAGYQADQFRPAIWIDNGIGGEKLIKLNEVGAAPAQPALQSLDVSQITISAKPLLVAERNGLLRLHVTAAQSPVQLPKFQLDLQLNGNSQLLDAAAPKKLPASKVHRSLTDAYQAIIPASWMKPGLQIKVLQDGQLVRTYAPQFAPARPLAIRIVPFQLGDQVATLPDINLVKNAVRTYWPFSQIDVRARAPYQLKAGGTKSSAYVMLPELADLRRIEGEGVYYYGYFKPGMGDNCCAGFGYLGEPIAVGYDSDNGEILAHELGHNFGRQHVDCGNPSSHDPAYPYPTHSMGSVGLDATLTGIKSPDDYADVMSYCDPSHVSDYNVAAVQDFVLKNPPAAFPMPAQAAYQAQTGSSALYLAGTLQGSSVQVRTLVPLSRAPRSEAASGYSIRVLNEQGSWFEFNLQLLQVDHQDNPSERHFSVELPQMTIQRFEIWHSGVLVATQENSAVVAGSASQKQQQQQQSQSQIQLDEGANQLCVTWPAGKDATLSVIHQQNGEDTVLALNETAGQFCRDSSALPSGGDWRLIWRQQLSVQEFRQAR